MAVLWRVFPWEAGAKAGAPYSASYVSPLQGSGRFDLPGRSAGVVYLAETPEHAVAESIQGFRNQLLDADDLLRWGRPLALARIELDDQVRRRVADLCDPAVLADYGIGPDRVSARERAATQAIALDLLERGHVGLRWWSAFIGEWHTVVLFRDRIAPGDVAYGAPEPLALDHPAVRDAAGVLDIDLP
jgi:hypothetical protein